MIVESILWILTKAASQTLSAHFETGCASARVDLSTCGNYIYSVPSQMLYMFSFLSVLYIVVELV